ncbi:hypothetical protein ACTFIY_005403 [Dictyostelium cf. discoideum]
MEYNKGNTGYNSGENYPSMDQYNYGQGNMGNMGNMGQQYQPPQQQQQQPPPQQQQQHNSGFGFPSPTLYNMNAQQQQQQQQQYQQQQHHNQQTSPMYGNNGGFNQFNNNDNSHYSPPQQGDMSRQFISQISDNPLTQAGLTYGLNYGQTLFSGGKQYVDSNFGKYFSFSTLKSYFNVNNSYVFNKIKLLIFPYTQKTWKRRIGRTSDVDSYLPPRDDINAPDLYIPLMAFITYFLLYGFQMGMEKKFSPDYLGACITKGIVFWAIELLIFKCGFFFSNSNSIPFYDMMSYSGYKYVLMVIFQIATILLGSYVSYIIKCVLSVSIAFFMLKTLRLVFSSVSGAHDHISPDYHESGKIKNYFVFGFSVAQALLCFLI